MSIKKNRVIELITVSLFILVQLTTLNSCSSSKPASPNVSATPPGTTDCQSELPTSDCEETPTTNTEPVTTDEICTTLKDSSKNQGMYASKEEAFVNEIDFLCQSVIGKASVYKGLTTQTPSYIGEPEVENENTDLFLMGGAYEVPTTTPNQFFQMMTLQLTRPSDFESQGFEGNDNVTYEIANTGAFGGSENIKTNYSYEYNDPNDTTKDWSYDGVSYLIPIVKNRIYIVANKHGGKTQDRLLDFKGFKAIVTSEYGVLIYYVSYQKMDTGGGEAGRNKTRDSVDESMKDEIRKDYRNGIQAKSL